MRMKWLTFFFFFFFIKDIQSQFMDLTELVLNPTIYLIDGSLDAGDFDNDGMLDFICGGVSVGNALNLKLYRQNQSLLFWDVVNQITFPEGIPNGYYFGKNRLVDVDHDGKLDIFYSGCGAYDTNNGLSMLYVQKQLSVFYRGNEKFFSSGGPIQTLYSFFDFVTFNQNISFLLICYDIPLVLYVANEVGLFNDVANSNTFPDQLPPYNMTYSNALWNDYDRDGLNDFLLIGSGSALLYRQNRSFVFYNIWNAATF